MLLCGAFCATGLDTAVTERRIFDDDKPLERGVTSSFSRGAPGNGEREAAYWIGLALIVAAGFCLMVVAGAHWKMALSETRRLSDAEIHRALRDSSLPLETSLWKTLDQYRPGPGWTPSAQARDWLALMRERTIHDLNATPVNLEMHQETGVRLVLTRGGRPRSWLSDARGSVADFVSRDGGAAGINGGFFTNAALDGTDSTMVGPVMAAFVPHAVRASWRAQASVTARFYAERDASILARIEGRPLVVWNATRIAIAPFHARLNDRQHLRWLIPDATDAFVGGVWMVHDGRATPRTEPSPPRDANDRRPRVFFGFTADGQALAGASLDPASTTDLARAAVAAGALEAVLLDSGYSTSLVYAGRTLAVGRHWDGVPSRPVPHAIVMEGALR